MPSTRTEWKRYIPPDLQHRLLRFMAPIVRRTPGRRVQWGNVVRDRPFSQRYGFDRGRPIDRRYIEDFLAKQRHLIHGDVLEVRSGDYSRRFGVPQMRIHVVDIDRNNTDATIIGDLCNPNTLPEASFDCVILTQTLHLIPDRDGAVTNAWRSLRPGGSLLITFPTISRVDTELPEMDCARLTPVGLQAWLERTCKDAELEVEGAGGLATSVAALLGLAEEDMDEAQIRKVDPIFPVIATAVARKPISN